MKTKSALLLTGTLCLTMAFTACGAGTVKDSSADTGQSITGSPKYQDSIDSSDMSTESAEGPDKVTEMVNFRTTDLKDNEYTNDVFKEADLTMVNVFTTWCTPCVEEIPYLQELSEEMKEKGVNILGIVADVWENGSVNEELLAKANEIAEKTKADYPMLLANEALYQGPLKNITAYPTTFFVDSEGNITGETYLGGRDKDGWTKIIEKELAAQSAK